MGESSPDQHTTMYKVIVAAALVALVAADAPPGTPRPRPCSASGRWRTRGLVSCSTSQRWTARNGGRGCSSLQSSGRSSRSTEMSTETTDHTPTVETIIIELSIWSSKLYSIVYPTTDLV